MFFLNNKIPISAFFPEKFIDIHSHLLPGIDDGAKNMNDSIALIEKMSSFGIKNLITTPHVMGDIYPNTSELIKEKLNAVKLELINRNITDVSIEAAAEYMLDEQFEALLEKEELLTLNDNYILVEMSYFNAPLNLFELLFKIQLKGYIPILAHPERYGFYHSNMNFYYKLKEAGCLFQLNLLSLSTVYGENVQNMCFKILKKNLFDFVGTDTHHENHLLLLEKISTKKNLKKITHLLENNARFLK